MTNPLWQWKKISYEFVEYSSPILKEILHFKKCPYEQQVFNLNLLFIHLFCVQYRLK